MSDDPRFLAGVGRLLGPAGMLFLALLLAADLVFIVLHLVRLWTPWVTYWGFDISHDRSYSEIYQYVKTFWVAFLLLLVALRTRQLALVGWSLLFAYILCDDAMMLHEQAGPLLARLLDLPRIGDVRPRDLGELTVFASVGLPLLSLIGIACLRGGATGRRLTLDLLVLLALLVSFGAVADVAEMALSETPLRLVLGLIEDGGEMLAMSCVGAYAFAVLLGGGVLDESLWQLGLRRLRLL